MNGMMLTQGSDRVIDSAALRNASLAKRQARVGIVANAVEVKLPSHSPRDVWTRWPKLRSARRPGANVQGLGRSDKADDPVLNGDRLKEFAYELRKSDSVSVIQEMPDVEIVITPAEALAPPFDGARLAIRVALGVLCVALALVGISLALG